MTAQLTTDDSSSWVDCGHVCVRIPQDQSCRECAPTEQPPACECVLQTCFQATTVSSAMFITAMAANPLAVNLAADALGTTISWGTWALAAIVPGSFTLLTMPLLLYVLYPPKVKDTPDAPIEAKKQLEKLGPMSTDEKITCALP